jgi:crossover junction endodeoxyribonuclease RuvC
MESGKLLHSACLRTSKDSPFEERLDAVASAAMDLIATWQPQAVALEKVYFQKNAKTAMQVAQVVGVLTQTAAAAGLTVKTYTPSQVKVAVTGSGSSDKEAVALMVGRLVALPSRKRLDDELDAIAVGITCLAHWRAY